MHYCLLQFFCLQFACVYCELCYDSGETSKQGLVLISVVNSSIQAYDIQEAKPLSSVALEDVDPSNHKVTFWWDKSDVIKVLASHKNVNGKNHLFKFDLNGKLVGKCSFAHGHLDDRYLFSEDGVTTCHAAVVDGENTTECSLYHLHQLNRKSGGSNGCSSNPIKDSYIIQADESNGTIMDSTDDHHCFVYVHQTDTSKKVTEKCLYNSGNSKGDENSYLTGAKISNKFATFAIGTRPYVTESLDTSQLVRVYRIEFDRKTFKLADIKDPKVKLIKTTDRLLMMSFVEDGSSQISDPFDKEWPEISLDSFSGDAEPIVALRKCQATEESSNIDLGLVAGSVAGGIVVAVIILVIGIVLIWKKRHKQKGASTTLKPVLRDPKVISVRRGSYARSVTVRTEKPDMDTVSTQGHTTYSSASPNRKLTDKPPLSDGSTIRRSIHLYDTMPKLPVQFSGAKDKAKEIRSY